MRYLLCGLVSLLPFTAFAQTISDTATGNFAGQDPAGVTYSADIYRAAENLVLRVWVPQDNGNLVLDNGQFAFTPLNGREWLEASPEGPLYVNIVSVNDGTIYAVRYGISQWDNMIAVLTYAEFVNRLPADGTAPDDPFQCFSDTCFSCVADLITGAVTVGGTTTTVAVAYDDLNASLWKSGRERDALGLCPAYD